MLLLLAMLYRIVAECGSISYAARSVTRIMASNSLPGQGEEDSAQLPCPKRARLESVGENGDRGEDGMAGNRVVLVLCGSFSPITNLHLRMLGEIQLGMRAPSSQVL